MDTKIIRSGAIMALLTVAIGAFGAHGLKGVLMQYDTVEIFETAVRYQGMHAIALLVLGVLTMQYETKWLVRSAWLFVLGVVFFSGSLYVLSVTGIKFLGAVTPIGGVLMILGWLSLIFSLKRKEVS
ncbi:MULTISPECIES: DUF423 domain-containing protein [Reichenbachiella]|uniref:Uncharacterized membrane protein YgdD, TMEM256/DUF423 family n=1 Tax=Reichenbachiella agariperforans TaxID=156994 RepID=A0A1M6JFT0_REIAG|nr:MULTISPECIES: DUF423 domain-containing protein [Reichenbachiella]MBU2913179.1 DUF423 domain-containing protein [Reichenbachiella agariperforans]RJE74821.1 hypothetical protein BGP76_16985 [Reichenbachiella sp. MSK19-1]SHJ45452.1 Uncharacterized membrane protein YgdD, TMEM256/DUF423 family [Reichenbachiella agariperforans]